MTGRDSASATGRGFLRSARSVRALIIGASLLTATAVLLTIVAWPRKPSPASTRTGDEALLAALGQPHGLNRLSVAVVDLTAAQRVRFADLGATNHTPYEAGSLTKAMTGLAVADAVERGELALTDRAGSHLDLGTSAAGRATVRQLVTHHSGYPRLGKKTLRRGWLTAFTAGNPYTTTLPELLAETRTARLTSPDRYAYSNLGAAVAGKVTAAAAGLSYPELMRERVFTPLGMRETVIADHDLVPRGYAASGLRAAPWVMQGYAPAGGMVTTSADLATFAEAALTGRAPGLAALTPIAGTDDAATRIGMFWHISTDPEGRRQVVWHNGRTGGYASFLGIDRDRRRAVIVLADVSTSVDAIGLKLLTEPV
jgi:CubicO group peptidase (beta-lactamase class C family)